jgi:diadenosine tetraphosphate (Ap4A) HIT family hydrolase
VLKRHATALHELSREELVEMGELLARVTKLLHTEFGCVKEYISCFAESEHFKHVHIHVIPRAADLPQELQGPRSFALIKATELDAVPPAEIVALCERLREHMSFA